MNSLGDSGEEEAVIYVDDEDAVVTSRGGPNTSRFRMIVIHNVACCLSFDNWDVYKQGPKLGPWEQTSSEIHYKIM